RDHRATSLPDRRGRVGRVELGAVAEVLARARLRAAARAAERWTAVRVEHAGPARGDGAGARMLPGVAAAADVTAEPVDAVAEPGPRPVREAADFPFEGDLVLLVVARRDLVLVLGVDVHVHHDVGERVRRGEVPAPLPVDALDGAADEDGCTGHG